MLFLKTSFRSLCTSKIKQSITKAQFQPDKYVKLISSKREQFNCTTSVLSNSNGKTKQFGDIALTSKGWMSRGSKGDYFIVHPIEDEHNGFEFSRKVEELPDLGIDSEIATNLTKIFSINKLTKVQEQALPVIMNLNHTLIAAETGCGKTLAYLIPLVSELLKKKSQKRNLNSPLAVIVTPGRELAEQIGNVCHKLSSEIKVKTLLGGRMKSVMLNPEFEEVDVLVASMGALSKVTTTGIYRMDKVRFVVIDEADTLLDDSFSSKLRYFLTHFMFHKNHIQSDDIVGTQLILASATMPTNIKESLSKIVDTETIHQVVSENLHKIMPHVKQKFMRINKSDRPAMLLQLVRQDILKKRPVIVFANKSQTSDFVSLFLSNAGVNCVNLNGDMLQKIRIGQFEKFQSGFVDVLSTTDVSSRGLDTTRSRHVINFDFPLHIADYIHRCGRIGRVSSKYQCSVTNFISSRREIDLVQRIEHAVRTGGILPNVNANITNIIHQKIIKDLKKEGIDLNENEPIVF